VRVGRDVTFDLEEIRAISDFNNGTSLYVSDFSSQVAVFSRTMSPWIGLGFTVNADNGRPLILPNVSADPTTYTPGEGTAITASDPTLGTATATPKAYKALALVSQEAEEDELIGLMGIIAKTQGRSLGLAFGTDATAAVLSGGTNGGTATGLGGVGTGTATFFGYEDLIDLKYGAAAPYRLNGCLDRGQRGDQEDPEVPGRERRVLLPGRLEPADRRHVRRPGDLRGPRSGSPRLGDEVRRLRRPVRVRHQADGAPRRGLVGLPVQHRPARHQGGLARRRCARGCRGASVPRLGQRVIPV
jgi:hypothetical protein